MTAPEAPAAILAELRAPGGEEPVFSAPWQAQAFALAFELHRAGVFPWSAFAERLAAEIAADGTSSLRGAAEASEAYYRAWLRSCEGLLAERGLVDDQRLARHYKAEVEAAKHRRAEGLARHHYHHRDGDHHHHNHDDP